MSEETGRQECILMIGQIKTVFRVDFAVNIMDTVYNRNISGKNERMTGSVIRTHVLRKQLTDQEGRSICIVKVVEIK